MSGIYMPWQSRLIPFWFHKFGFVNSKFKYHSFMWHAWENPVHSRVFVGENKCISRSPSMHLNHHISLDLAISPSCQFSLSFSSCPGLALMRKWILWPTSSYISSKRKSISAVTTFTLTLFPISRYFVFVETPPGHRNGSRILCKRWEDLDVGVKWNNLSNSEGEKYRSRSGSRMRTASTWPLHWAWPKASKTAAV